MRRLLKIFAILTVAISCRSLPRGLPAKPSIDSGVLILQTNEVFFVNNQTGQENSWPIILPGTCELNPKLNKTILHSNPHWNSVLLYIKLLEARTPKRVREELRKARRASEKALERAHGL